MPTEAIPVAVHGFTWTTALVGVLNLLVGGALVSWIRSRPSLRQIETSADADLRRDLLKRVETLERRLDEERALHEAQIAIMRHRLNNSDQCIDALLMLLETSPDKVSEAVVMIKDMRVRQREAEAVEKAAFHAAKITGPLRGEV
jgi:signal transduction histidine kinase